MTIGKQSFSATVDRLDDFQTSGRLSDVSFTAQPFNVTGVIGPEKYELRTIAELVGSMRDSGIFDGEVYVSGQPAENSLLPAENIAFVAHNAYKLYLPGLTYGQTVHYNAMLRLQEKGDPSEIAGLVDNALELMGLTRYKNRVIPERPITRGTLGGELRRLRIAADICLMPSIIVLEEPIIGLDFGVAGDLMKRLKSLADLGRTVVCLFSKPDLQTFEALDNVVMVVEGRTVFNSKRENVIPHFTSTEMGYLYNPDVSSVSDFILDIAVGVERPSGHRSAVTAYDMQQIFEASEFFEPPPKVEHEQKLLPAVRATPYYDLLFKSRHRAIWRRVYVALERAVVTKFSEYAVLKKSVITAIVPAVFMGYFLYGQGDSFGDYTMSLFNFPYPEVTNVASNMFIANAFAFVTQVLNVHIICQKMKVFRSEQRSGTLSGAVFLASTFIAEAAFTAFYITVFSVIVYYMMDLGSGWENIKYFVNVQLCTSLYAMVTCLLLAAVFRKEFIVRDIFLLGFFLMVMVSGFPFPLSVFRDTVLDISKFNPLRWSFEGMLKWKFYDYIDGPQYLATYQFQSFDHKKVYDIFRNFFAFSGGLLAIALIPKPRILRRRRVDERPVVNRLSTSRMSMDSDFDGASRASFGGKGLTEGMRNSEGRRNSRNSERDTATTAPVLLMRATASGAANVSLSRSTSTTLNKEGETERGPTVTVTNLSFRVIDPRSPLGHRNILNNITAKFDWGKLCVVMGAKDSGKSTLLHLLSGSRNNAATKITGDVHFDGRFIDPSLKAWQRAAYVEALDDHFRDLSVREIVTYAMSLRCYMRADLDVVESNVDKTLELLHLVDLQHERAKLLSRGDRRRLSIAEELVQGPSLLLADEPITNLPARDAALIMNCFRDLVNQEKTVIATMHEPSSEVFSLFDSLVLLSKGRLIYMGAASEAVSFFTEKVNLVSVGYVNPADFLADVSGCLLKNEDGNYVDTPALVTGWKKSSQCIDQEDAVTRILSGATDMETGEGSMNPMAATSTDSKDKATLDASRILSDDPNSRSYWTGTRSMDISTMENSLSRSKSKITGHKTTFSNYLIDLKSFFSCKRVNVSMTLYRLWIVFFREVMSMVHRPKMIFASFVLQIFIASLYGILMKASVASSSAAAVTSYFGIGAILIMLTMLQLAYYLFNNLKIFLREHNRGLYSMVSYWMVGLLPLLMLRVLQYSIYALLSHKFMGLQSGDIGKFYYLNMFLFQLAHTLYIMFFVIPATELRSIYYAIPGLGFFFFYFSGMLVKPSTLPEWAAPWMPSVSPVRWFMQAGVINEAYNNEAMFPPLPAGSFDIYKAYLGFFGWNGKTKYECLLVLGFHVMIAFGMCLVGFMLVSSCLPIFTVTFFAT